MDLHGKIMTIYPTIPATAFQDGTIVLRNDSDGKGDYIKTWNYTASPQPTAAQLAAIP